MAWERYAAVPGGDGTSLVVVDGRLPSATIDSYRLPDALAALASSVSPTTTSACTSSKPANVASCSRSTAPTRRSSRRRSSGPR